MFGLYAALAFWLPGGADAGGPGNCHNCSVLAKWFIHCEAEKGSVLAGCLGGSGGAVITGLGLS